jgi:hypothetical protein
MLQDEMLAPMHARTLESPKKGKERKKDKTGQIPSATFRIRYTVGHDCQNPAKKQIDFKAACADLYREFCMDVNV